MFTKSWPALLVIAALLGAAGLIHVPDRDPPPDAPLIAAPTPIVPFVDETATPAPIEPPATAITIPPWIGPPSMPDYSPSTINPHIPVPSPPTFTPPMGLGGPGIGAGGRGVFVVPR
jgi:hypothetical protein